MALPFDRISSLIERISRGNDQLAAGDSSGRLSMLQCVWNLAHALENPDEGLMRLLAIDVSS